MSYYIDNYNNRDYGRRTVIERNPKYPEKRRSMNHSLNSSKNRDNSAILRRAINKRYKEDINKNILKADNYNDFHNNDYEENEEYNDYDNNIYNNEYNEYQNNNLYDYNNKNYNSNYKPNYISNYYSNNKSNFHDNNDKNFYDQALISRIHNNRKRNMGNYYTANISNDNIYDEFIINYNRGVNNEDYEINPLNRNMAQFNNNPMNNNLNNQIYNRSTINYFNRNKYHSNNQNNIDVANSQINFLYRPQIENIDGYIMPYQKRRINNYTYKDNKENGMANYVNISKIRDKLYLRNKTGTNSFFIKKNNFNTFDGNNNYDRNYNLINYDNNRKDYNNINNEYHNIVPNKPEYYSATNKKYNYNQNNEENITDFLEHIIRYCFLYYFKVTQKVFNFLKNQKKMPKITKYIKNKPKINKIPNQDKKNLYMKNKIDKYQTVNYINNYQTYSHKPIKSKMNKINNKEDTNERIPYHRNNTHLLIERIKSNNQSVSPDKKNKAEMFRNFDELNKKYEIIYNRKNRLSFTNTKRSLNDLSFNSENKMILRNSVEKNKEIFENNINKERERRKKIMEKRNKKKEELQNKEKNNLEIKNKHKKEEKSDELSKLIKKNEELKKKIKKAIEDNKLNIIKNNIDKDINKNNIDNKIYYMERKKIRDKYKKKKTNKKNDKYEMIDVKKITTKDKSIHINIKYLNYIPMKIKNNKEKNKFELLNISNNLNISLFAIKDNKGIKKKIINENNENNLVKKLSSIQEENKIDLNELSDSISYKSEEKK